MKFISIRDLRTSTAKLRRELDTEQEVVITANGQPFAVMTRVDPDRLEEEVMAMRRSRVRSALSRARAKARASDPDRVTMDSIEDLIAKVRRDRRRGR